MGDDGTIATFCLLKQALEVLFGTKTVPVEKFGGTGLTLLLYVYCQLGYRK